jgi:flagellar M-ring protein FliF
VPDGVEITVENVPRSPEQLEKLKEIIAQAVGLNLERNDRISIESLPFETREIEEPKQQEVTPIQEVERYSNYILMFLALGAALFVLKGLLKRLKNEKIMIGSLNYNDESFNDLSPSLAGASGKGSLGSGGQNQLQKQKRNILESGNIEDEITDEAQEKQMKHNKIVNYVSKNPSEAAKLINSWLRDDEY